MVDCTAVNSTQIVFFPPPDFTFTAFENATAPMKDEFNITTGLTDRFYLNGTVARFNGTGDFLVWIVPPKNNTLFAAPTTVTVTYGEDGSKTVTSGPLTTFYSAPLNVNSSQIENATGILYQEKDSEINVTRTFFRNGSASVLFWNNNTFRWMVAPKQFFIPFVETINTEDGSKTTSFADGRSVTEFKEPTDTTPDFERYTAMSRSEKFPNGTTVQSYFNGTVAEMRNGTFFGYRVAPKFFMVKIDTVFNSDGSQQINFSNGTSIWLAPPPPKNETAEQFAFRVTRVESFNLTKIVSYANGTVAIFLNGSLGGYRVQPPTGLFVSRNVEYLADGGVRESFSNGTIRTTFGPASPELDELARARFVVFEELNTVSLRVTRRYLNGTVAVFNSRTGQFLLYIVAPTKLYTGCVSSRSTSGDIMTRCWNDTIRITK